VWAPGRMVAGIRPVYAPALVAFVGGPRFSVAVGIGGGVGVAAWFPLGPGEVYRPAYHVSEVYVRNVNIVHVTNVNVTNVRYVNQNVAGAVMVVPHTAFASGRPVAAAAVVVRPGAIGQAEVIETARVAPTREAVLGHGGPMIAHAPPARFVDRTVVARNAPPPPPVSFAAREQALRANGGRPLEPAVVNNYRPAGERHPMVRTVVNNPGGPAPAGGPRQEPGRRFGQENPPVPQAPRNDRPPNGQRPYNEPGNQPQAQPPAMQHRAPVNTTPAPPAQRPQAEPQRQPQAQPPQGRGEHPRNEERMAPRGQQRRDTKKPDKQ